MKTKPHRFLSVLAGALLLTAGSALAELEIGQTMPLADREMKSTQETMITLNQTRGPNGTVVVFWCNHCPFVKLWRTRLIAITKDYKDRGIAVIAVNSNDPLAYPGDDFQQMRLTADQYEYPFAYVVDDGAELARAFGATRTPHVFAFGPDNKLAYVGAIDDNARSESRVKEAYLRDALEAILAKRQPARAQTRAFGCTIKWPAQTAPTAGGE